MGARKKKTDLGAEAALPQRHTCCHYKGTAGRRLSDPAVSASSGGSHGVRPQPGQFWSLPPTCFRLRKEKMFYLQEERQEREGAIRAVESLEFYTPSRKAPAVAALNLLPLVS